MNSEPVSGILLSRMQFPIRWGDMDALAHVNNTLYLRYFEESRVSWAEGIGMPLRTDGEGMILAKATVTFKKPVTYPATVTVDLLAGNIGRSSFTLLNTLTVAGESDPSATGECVTVWYDYIGLKSMPLPQKLRSILAGERDGTSQVAKKP